MQEIMKDLGARRPLPEPAKPSQPTNANSPSANHGSLETGTISFNDTTADTIRGSLALIWAKTKGSAQFVDLDYVAFSNH